MAAGKSMPLGKAMRAWRERDGASMKAAWGAIGVPEREAKSYESGQRVPHQVACAIRLVGAARLYGIPVFGKEPR